MLGQACRRSSAPPGRPTQVLALCDRWLRLDWDMPGQALLQPALADLWLGYHWEDDHHDRHDHRCPQPRRPGQVQAKNWQRWHCWPHGCRHPGHSGRGLCRCEPTLRCHLDNCPDQTSRCCFCRCRSVHFGRCHLGYSLIGRCRRTDSERATRHPSLGGHPGPAPGCCCCWHAVNHSKSRVRSATSCWDHRWDCRCCQLHSTWRSRGDQHHCLYASQCCWGHQSASRCHCHSSRSSCCCRGHHCWAARRRVGWSPGANPETTASTARCRASARAHESSTTGPAECGRHHHSSR